MVCLWDILHDDIIQYILNDWCRELRELRNLDIALCNRNSRSFKYMNIPKVSCTLRLLLTPTTFLKTLNTIGYYLLSRNIQLDRLVLKYRKLFTNTINELLSNMIQSGEFHIWWKSLRNLTAIIVQFLNLDRTTISSNSEDYFSIDIGALQQRLPTLKSCSIHCEKYHFEASDLSSEFIWLEELHLYVGHEMCGEKKMMAWLQKHCPKLKELNMSGIKGPTIPLLAIHHSFPALERLEINIEAIGLQQIVQSNGFANNCEETSRYASRTVFPKLERLKLIIPNLPMKQWDYLLDTLSMGCVALKSLLLSFPTAHYDHSFERLYSIIATRSTLERLNIRFNASNDVNTSIQVAQPFLTTLCPSCTFRQLLSITIEAMIQFDDSYLDNIMNHCNKLQQLSLGTLPNITDEGMKQLFVANQMQNITELKIFDCKGLTEETFRALLSSTLIHHLTTFRFSASSEAASTFNTLRASRYWYDYVYGVQSSSSIPSALRLSSHLLSRKR